MTKKIGQNIIDENIDENNDVVEEIPLLPPAKKKSRLGLTYCENITNIDKRVTRLSKRNKNKKKYFIVLFVDVLVAIYI